MLVYKRRIVVKASPGRVWAFVSDLRNVKELLSGADKSGRFVCEFESATPMGPGANAEASITLGGRPVGQTWTVVGWTPPSEMVLEAVSKRVHAGMMAHEMRIAIRIGPANATDSTVELESSLDIKSPLLRFVSSVFRSFIGVDAVFDGFLKNLHASFAV